MLYTVANQLTTRWHRRLMSRWSVEADAAAAVVSTALWLMLISSRWWTLFTVAAGDDSLLMMLNLSTTTEWNDTLLYGLSISCSRTRPPIASLMHSPSRLRRDNYNINIRVNYVLNLLRQRQHGPQFLPFNHQCQYSLMCHRLNWLILTLSQQA